MSFDRMPSMPSPEAGGNLERARLIKELEDLMADTEELVKKRNYIDETSMASGFRDASDGRELNKLDDAIAERNRAIDALREKIEGLA